MPERCRSGQAPTRTLLALHGAICHNLGMELPPAQVTRAVVQRYARVLHRYRDDLGDRPLVLPTSTYFPDHFVGDAASVSNLVRRMQEHAAMVDIPLEPTVVVPGSAAPADAGSCSTGSCGVPQAANTGLARLVDRGEEGWLLQVPEAELKHPIALTTNLARSLAYVFMVETQLEGERFDPPVDVTADVVAVALGFGPLMLQGSYIYAKSCGGPQVARVTKMSVVELAVAVAAFAAAGGHKLAPALKALDVTQRSALSEAKQLMRANDELVELLKTNPERAARGKFELEEPNGFLAGLFRRKRKHEKTQALGGVDPNMEIDEVESLLIDMPPSSQAGRQSQPTETPADPEKQELRDLVGEALRQARV